MREAEKRLEVLNAFINKETNAVYLQTTIESEALQLRKLLELIAYASLVAHKDAYKSVRKDIDKDWHAKRILRKIESLNPNFDPIPTNGVSNGKWNTPRGGYLTRKQFETLYDKCGKILHSKNPFSNTPQHLLSFHKKMPNHVARIQKLLSEHRVRLASSNEMIHVRVQFFTDAPMELRLLGE